MVFTTNRSTEIVYGRRNCTTSCVLHFGVVSECNSVAAVIPESVRLTMILAYVTSPTSILLYCRNVSTRHTQEKLILSANAPDPEFTSLSLVIPSCKLPYSCTGTICTRLTPTCHSSRKSSANPIFYQMNFSLPNAARSPSHVLTTVPKEPAGIHRASDNFLVKLSAVMHIKMPMLVTSTSPPLKHVHSHCAVPILQVHVPFWVLPDLRTSLKAFCLVHPIFFPSKLNRTFVLNRALLR